MSTNDYTPQSLWRDLKRLGYPKQKTPRGQWLEIRAALRNENNRHKLGMCPWYREHEEFIRQIGLPGDLLRLIEEDRVIEAIDHGRACLQAINERLDGWEAAYPARAADLPWRESRDAWMAAGRPELPWWQVLQVTEGWRRR